LEEFDQFYLEISLNVHYLSFFLSISNLKAYFLIMKLFLFAWISKNLERMNDIQHYLQDFLTIDCEIQTNLQQLLLVTTRDGLESKSAEIKRLLKEFKEKLNEMKDFCDSFNSNPSSGNSLISRLVGVTSGSDASLSSTTMNPNSPRDLFVNEYLIHKDQLNTVESRYRNAYLAAQNKLDQIERENLLSSEGSNSTTAEMKKRNLNSQILLKQSTETTNKLSEISRQLKWVDSQAGEIIPVLDESSKGIRNVQQEFGMMRGAINDGKRLLTRLGRREFTDKLLIVLCLCFFFSVVFYIIWKRL
jgi:hypothetical protein